MFEISDIISIVVFRALFIIAYALCNWLSRKTVAPPDRRSDAHWSRLTAPFADIKL
jgi:hypothetical protein